MKRYIYLLSPPKIRGDNFYKELHQVLKTNKVRYFQLRLKKISDRNLLNISKKIKKIVKKNNVKFLINDKPLIAKKANADGCHIGQKDMDLINCRKILGKNKIIVYPMKFHPFWMIFNAIKTDFNVDNESAIKTMK